MNTFKRRGNKWSVNELLQLQREYELLELTIQEIAEKHQRSVEAILYRLEDEGFINSWSQARGYKMGSDDEEDIINEYVKVDEFAGGDDNNSEYVCEDIWNESDDDNSITSSDRLNDRVSAIEETLEDIKEMIATILANTQQKNAKNNLQNELPDTKSLHCENV